MTRPRHPHAHAQAGMTLIEVLVALLIFSFGLLGFVGLQARAIQYSVSAENSNRAALLANELVTIIQLKGSLSALSASDISAWQQRVTSSSVGIPGATSSCTPVGTNSATITIQWQRSGTAAASSAATMDQYQTQVYLP